MPEKSVIAEKRVYNMTPEVKERIDQLRHGIVPEGYKKTKAGIVPAEWTEYAIAGCLKRVERPVEVKSDEMYTQIGIRSHGKGLFYKEPVNGKALGNKSVFWIEPDCFVLNIVFAWEQAIGKTTQKEVGMIGSHRFPMYQQINERVDIDYLISYLMTKRGKDILEAASPGGAGRNRTLGQDRFMNSKIVLPTLTEQKKIASILTMQDKIIELEQQKIEEIKKAKRFYFEKMFPKEGQAVPEIRFKGFTNTWEQRKVQDVADRFDNLRIPVAANLRVHGTTPYYGANGIQDYVDGFTHDGEFVLVAEDGANDLKNYPVKCVNGRIWVNNHAHVLQGKAGIADNSFLAFAISQSDIESLLVGGGRAKLNAETLMSIEFRLPCLQEQYRIGEYLTQLDHLITLHQRKLEEEKRKKKTLMQLLLTGLVRVNA